MRKTFLIAIISIVSLNCNSQDLEDNFISDKGYFGLAYLSKQSSPNWGFMGGWTRYYSKFNASILIDGSLDLHFDSNTTESSSRYYYDQLSNGQSRCRDRETGRFASSSLCESLTEISTNTSVRLSGLFNYHIPMNENIDFVAGVGYIISNHSTPIFSIGLRPSPKKGGLAGSIGFGRNYFYIGVLWVI